MRKIGFKYNPFTVETCIFDVDSGMEWPENALTKYSNIRLQMWLNELFPLLTQSCNDDIEVFFEGTQFDFNDVLLAYNEYMSKNPELRVVLAEPIIAEGVESRFEDLKRIFTYLQQTCPFEDLRTQQVRDNFEAAIGSEFEVSVIATMSSGKSTLINAMLGNQLMPAKNQACTATIAKIKDIDNMLGFTARCTDAKGNVIAATDELTSDLMAEYNDNEKVAYINIEGDIPFVSSKNVNLVLLDTPGPNNSRTEEHRKHTYKIIKGKAMPMVLYVLNGTQLETNDDADLLGAVAEAMNIGGKQARDRFIFAVNKADQFDDEKESLQRVLDNVEAYLAKYGIKQPNIYPVSAEIAKVLRLAESGAELTRSQRRTLTNASDILGSPEMHLEEYAPLSSQTRQKMLDELKAAEREYDERKVTLIHTGIPAIELAINEYLDKYALTNKVKTAVDTFNKQIQEKALMGNLSKQLEENEQLRREVQSQIKRIKAQQADGRKAQEFRNRINNLDISKSVDMHFRKMGASVTKELDESVGIIQSDSKMSVSQAKNAAYRLDSRVRDLQGKVQADLENIIEEVVTENAKKILDEYQQHIQSLLEDASLHMGNFTTNNTMKLLEVGVPDATELINRYSRTETTRVKVGEEWVENENKHWYLPWTWFEPSQICKSVYETRTTDYVDGEAFYENYFHPVRRSFIDNLDAAKGVALKEADNFKKFFFGELDKLDRAMESKLKELERLSGDEETLKQENQANKEKMAWLEDFQRKLMNILAV